MLTVNDLMSSNPAVVTSKTKLQEVVATMNNLGCRHLLVVEQQRLVGIISDRDVRLAIDSPILSDDLEFRQSLLATQEVSSCMTKDPVFVRPSTSIQKAAEILWLHKIGALPVLANDHLVGILTVTDFIRRIAEQPEIFSYA